MTDEMNKLKEITIKEVARRNFIHFHRAGIFTLLDLAKEITARKIHIYVHCAVFTDPYGHIRQAGKITWTLLLNELSRQGFDWRDYHVGAMGAFQGWGFQKKMSSAQSQNYAEEKVDELTEKLAAYAHGAWSGWMKYMFEKSIPVDGDRLNDDGSWTMPAYFVERWHRQMLTPYADLPESEKESDRVEARQILDIISRK